MIPPRELAPGLWRLGSYHLPVYLVEGARRAALVEVGGYGTPALVAAQLAATGVRPEEVGLVVLTHAHSDHVAGWPGLLARFPAARLVLTAGAQGLLAKPAIRESFHRQAAFTAPLVGQRDGIAPAGDWPESLPELPAARLLLAAPGQELDLGGGSLRLMAAAGHDPDGLTLFLPRERALLCSDSCGLVTAGGPGMPLFFVSLTAYLAQMAELAALDPAHLLPGHQQTLSGPDVPDYLGLVQGQLARIHTRVREHCRGGGEAAREEMADWIFARYYHGEMTVYEPRTIRGTCSLLVRRVLEAPALV
ncbi:MAG: MBL fold metallo-hydrolase [Deltaproteobacteria bacterium]|nr:MBL fold metallo-hydrolase [Deltaproteobacteria bacterium]